MAHQRSSEQGNSYEETSDAETERSSEQESSGEETADAKTQWKEYLQGGCKDHRLARQLLTGEYRPLRPKPAGSAASLHERGRHAAEVKFFESHSRGARSLMAEEVEQLFRKPSKKPADPIDLREKSAREVIAASRLFQETMIVLSGSFNPSEQEEGLTLADTYRGIPLARSKKLEYGSCHYGPPVKYVVGDAEQNGTEVICEHRTDPLDAETGQQRPVGMWDLARLGDSYVNQVPNYKTISDELKTILKAFVQGRTKEGAQQHLAGLFIQYARSHQFDETPELNDSQRQGLFRICFLILEKEQSQWQSACFWWGEWKLGMAVSFARLILLFQRGLIDIDGLFSKYAIYSRKSMKYNFDEVQKTCDEIDKLYYEDFPELKYEHLSEDDASEQAYRDLEAVYGRDEDLTVDEDS